MSWQLQVLSSACWFKNIIHLIEYSFNETDMIDDNLMVLNDTLRQTVYIYKQIIVQWNFIPFEFP